MPNILGRFQWSEHSREFLNELQEIVGSEAIQLRPALRNLLEEGPDDWPTGEDPLGAARLMGTPIQTLPGVGMMLVGNSTTVDVSLEDLGRLLAELAQEDPHEDEPTPGAAMLIGIEAPVGRIEDVLNHLHRHGIDVHEVQRE